MKTILATITLGSIIMVSICHAQSIRKDYNEMTEDEIEAYVDAIYELHLGIITELADYHDNNFFTLHLNEMDEDVFLAWHRMAMLEMEDSIRTIYPELSIPYWNWVTDDSENDPLWDQDFLGQFDDEQEYEDLGRTFSQFEDLPDQSDVNYVQSINTWEGYTLTLEGNVVHTGGHQWVGGVMADPNSPLDPVFYFHHGMIDKLWQEWEEEFSASSYVVTSLPRYTAIDPDDITDSRDLKVWYADDGVVLLDQYDTDDTEVYSYTGKINAENDFIVKSGSDVTFTAGESVVLGPGFRAESGSTFLASVDPDVGDILPQVKEDAPMVEPVDNVSQMDKPIEWSLSQNYPNPFNPATHISYSVAERSHVRMAVYTITGRRVATLVNEVRDAGTHTVWFDASRLASGIYIYRIQAGSFIQTRQMTVIK